MSMSSCLFILAMWSLLYECRLADFMYRIHRKNERSYPGWIISYTDDIIFLHKSKFGDYVNSIYLIGVAQRVSLVEQILVIVWSTRVYRQRLAGLSCCSILRFQSNVSWTSFSFVFASFHFCNHIVRPFICCCKWLLWYHCKFIMAKQFRL